MRTNYTNDHLTVQAIAGTVPEVRVVDHFTENPHRREGVDGELRGRAPQHARARVLPISKTGNPSTYRMFTMGGWPWQLTLPETSGVNASNAALSLFRITLLLPAQCANPYFPNLNLGHP